MHKMKFVAVLALLVGMGTSQACLAQDTYGSASFANFLNSSGRFHHARNYGGAEVIYRSSGTANQADAMRWWMNSPPHRRLIQAGMIQEIQCVGNVCVGRGGGGSSTASDMTYASYGDQTSYSEQSASDCSSGNCSSGRRFRLFRRR